MDLIELRGIRARGKHGANVGEREEAQVLAVDVRLQLDLTPASRSDQLEETVDYDRVHKAIVRIVEERSYELLERLAAELLDSIFTDSRIAAAQVRIAKPRRLAGATPAITLHRKNPHFDGTWA
ncbi:MAG: dihydroneopterin aldolase [Candidatus Eremiobacteraeota bacterium]|nr:dihydroneopterin aldolase [Candidatus Eremiobacteraeota bacterium]